MKMLLMLIEIKREEMYAAIDTYGINDLRTVKKSSELDRLIAMEQRIKLCVIGANYSRVSTTK